MLISSHFRAFAERIIQGPTAKLAWKSRTSAGRARTTNRTSSRPRPNPPCLRAGVYQMNEDMSLHLRGHSPQLERERRVEPSVCELRKRFFRRRGKGKKNSELKRFYVGNSIQTPLGRLRDDTRLLPPMHSLTADLPLTTTTSTSYSLVSH